MGEDLIRREDAIRELLTEITQSDEGMLNRYDIVCIMKEIPPAKDAGWIPVKDRLPDIGVEVLTSTDSGYFEIQTLELIGDMKLWEDRRGDWEDFEDVEAWQPLPEPWEGEKNG